MSHPLSRLRIPTSGLFSTLVGCPPADARSVLRAGGRQWTVKISGGGGIDGIFVDGSTHSLNICFTNFLNDLRYTALILNRVK